MKAWHFRVVGFLAVAVAMWAILVDRSFVWVAVAAVVVLASGVGEWALERRRRGGTPPEH